MRMTRRTFLAAAAGTAAALLAGCGRNGASSEWESDRGQTSLVGVSADADAGTVSDDGLGGVRELVDLDVDEERLMRLDDAHVSPDSSTVEGTVLTADVRPLEQQRFFLWEEGRVPAVTEDGTGGSDPDEFRPTITSVPVPAGTAVKGAVLLCAGGAFIFRGDNADCYPTAEELSRRGYQCFVVDYRLRPYSQQEGALDLARAVRFVRAHADEYGLPNDRCIAVGGYSAGGILCGEELINWQGDVTPDALDPSYGPDELDRVSADAAADAMIYSFYGRLSVASLDADLLAGADLPPTFYCYGTRDPFYDQFEKQIELMADLGYTVHARVLEGWPHGFGALGDWIPEFDDFMQEAFALGGPSVSLS